MATQSLALGSGLNRPAADGGLGAWRSYHLHYHADLDLLLAELVRPLVSELLGDGVADRFYFVRYGLGGPHLRLRLRWTAEPAPAAVAAAAAEFFRRHPSRDSLPSEVVLRRNRPLLRIDPTAEEDDDRALPDNSLREAPPRFEIERYGGADRFVESLDLFALSSACVLLLLGGGRERLSAGLRLNRAFTTVGALAWGLAEDEGDFFDLAGYAEQFMGEPFAHCSAEADRVFERQAEPLVGLLRRSLAAPADAGDPRAALAEGGRRLAAELAGLAPDARWYVAASHLHMTLNRLGTLNAEEVYAGRLLWRAAGELRRRDAASWRAAWAARPPRRRPDETGVAALLPALFARLAEPAAADARCAEACAR